MRGRGGSFVGVNSEWNNTTTYAKVGGTDLGISVNLKDGSTLLLFGDTFSDEFVAYDWRSGVVAKTTDTNLADGLTIDSWWTSNGFSTNAMAESPLKSFHENDGGSCAFGETTKIYTGGIEIGDSIYLFYVSRFGESSGALDRNNYGGVIKSTDGGVTWKRVPDLTWVDHATDNENGTSGRGGTGRSVSMLQKIVNLDINISKYVGGVKYTNLDDYYTAYENAYGDNSDENNKLFNIDLTTHEAYDFTQIYPVNGGDGYIYIFGRGGYRNTGVKLGRVKIGNFENFSEYEYLTSFNKGKPVWTKGRAGLAITNEEDHVDSFVIEKDEYCSNFSVAYSKEMDKWVMSYLLTGAAPTNTDGVGQIVMRVSDSVACYWSDTERFTVLRNRGEKRINVDGGGYDIETTNFDARNLYGAYLNDRWFNLTMDNEGNLYCETFFIWSRWRDVGESKVYDADERDAYRSYVGKFTFKLTKI